MKKKNYTKHSIGHITNCHYFSHLLNLVINKLVSKNKFVRKSPKTAKKSLSK